MFGKAGQRFLGFCGWRDGMADGVKGRGSGPNNIWASWLRRDGRVAAEGLFAPLLAVYLIVFHASDLTVSAAIILVCLLFRRPIAIALSGLSRIIGDSEIVSLQIGSNQINMTRRSANAALQKFMSDSVNRLTPGQQSLFLYILENRTLTHTRIGGAPFNFRRDTLLHDDFSALRDALLLKPAKEENGTLKIGGSWREHATIYVTDFADYIVDNGLLKTATRFDQKAFSAYIESRRETPRAPGETESKAE